MHARTIDSYQEMAEPCTHSTGNVLPFNYPPDKDFAVLRNSEHTSGSSIDAFRYIAHLVDMNEGYGAGHDRQDYAAPKQGSM